MAKSGANDVQLAISIFDNLGKDWSFQSPSNVPKITTIDTHTGGEPLRIVLSGLPPIYGDNVLEKWRYFKEHYDHLRTGLLLEPRGHADMYGAILTKSSTPSVDIDCFFLNTDGYSSMCGHGILAITKVVIDAGMFGQGADVQDITISVPAGLVHARGVIGNDGVVKESLFNNVPSFAYLLDQQVAVPGMQEKVTFDISFGGAFYAFVDADSLDLDLTAANYRTLIDFGRKIKQAIMESFTIEHPFESDLSGLFGVSFVGKAHDSRNHSRNVNVFEDGGVDRSSTGTGVSGRAALHFAKGELALGQKITIESITGSTMTVQALTETTFGQHKAIIPEVGGEAHITGKHELYFHPDDPFCDGFMLR